MSERMLLKAQTFMQRQRSGARHQSYRTRALKYGGQSCSIEDFREWLKTHEADACAECGAPSNSTDHVIPLSKGGHHLIENLQRLCGSCNARKWAWLPTDTRTYPWSKPRLIHGIDR